VKFRAAGAGRATVIRARQRLDSDASAGALRRCRCCRHLGRTDYQQTWQAMVDFTAARSDGTADELWCCEHPPVLTLGQAGKPSTCWPTSASRWCRPTGAARSPTTVPGQVVIYLLLDLPAEAESARAGLAIEQAVIDLLAEQGVTAERHGGAPGVYVATAKVAALGLRVRKKLLLSRRQPERRHGSVAFCGDQSLRLPRHAGHADPRSRHFADARRRRRRRWRTSRRTTGAGKQ
jgi:hypothetical protein